MDLSDAIEDEGKRLENLVRGIFAGNIFDLGSAQVCNFLIVVELVSIRYLTKSLHSPLLEFGHIKFLHTSYLFLGYA